MADLPSTKGKQSNLHGSRIPSRCPAVKMSPPRRRCQAVYERERPRTASEMIIGVNERGPSGQQLFQIRQVYWLDQMSVAPGLARPLFVALLAPAGQRDDGDGLGP